MSQTNQTMQNYQNVGGLPASAAAQVKPDGAFTQRIRSLAARADEQEFRLRNILKALRVAPPEPVTAASTGLNVVHSTIQDQLERHESASINIDAALSELEGLFG